MVIGGELIFNVQGGNMGVVVVFGEGKKLYEFYKVLMFGMEKTVWCWALDWTLKWQKHNINISGAKQDLLLIFGLEWIGTTLQKSKIENLNY